MRLTMVYKKAVQYFSIMNLMPLTKFIMTIPPTTKIYYP